MCINKNDELLLYYERAKSKLNYNPITGDFTWKDNYSARARKGRIAGSVRTDGYRGIGQNINGKRKVLKAHRLAYFMILGELPNVIDHIDGDKDNNEISNLRSCTNQQNQMNRVKYENNKSGFKGISWHKPSKKWQAQIKINGRKKHLGVFATAEEASEVYEASAVELFGEFYNTNTNIKE
jgi:hypothetical protein